MQKKNQESIRVPARLENLEKLVEFALDALRRTGVGEREAAPVHLAIDEACTNCISYAYPEGQEGEIELACRIEPEEIVFTIRDWGRPFNPLKAEAPDLSLGIEDRPVGGLGIYLMKKSCDRLEYRREEGANVLRIIKKRSDQ